MAWAWSVPTTARRREFELVLVHLAYHEADSSCLRSALHIPLVPSSTNAAVRPFPPHALQQQRIEKENAQQEKFWHSQTMKSVGSKPSSPSLPAPPPVGAPGDLYFDALESRSVAGMSAARSAAPTGFTSKTSVRFRHYGTIGTASACRYDAMLLLCTAAVWKGKTDAAAGTRLGLRPLLHWPLASLSRLIA